MKVFDLFSGCGGFRLGFKQTGFKVTGFCEIDKHAAQFYRQAFNTENEVYFDDATKIITGELPDFDILCGGFPCQAFSIAGKRQGFNDTRGTLFFDVVRILKDCQPKYFVLENVKGLLNHDNGRTFSTIISTLTNIGYCVEWALLNSKHFGVPQNRERVFIVGYIGKRSVGKIFPLKKTAEFYNERQQNKEKMDNIASTIKARDYASWNGNFVSQICNVNPSGKGQNGNVYSEDGLCPTLTTNKGEGVKVGIIRADEGFRENIENISPTLCARAREDRSGLPVITIPVLTPDRAEKRQNGRRFKENGEEMFTLTGQDKHGIYNGKNIRRLTPKECFRLQGFPDEVFHKGSRSISDAQLYKMAGNSVTVNVVYEIAKKIKQIRVSKRK